MSYDALKKEIRKIILAAQDLVQKSEFIKYVKHDGHKMQKIDNDLEIWMKDLERDCAIIFAGKYIFLCFLHVLFFYLLIYLYIYLLYGYTCTYI